MFVISKRSDSPEVKNSGTNKPLTNDGIFYNMHTTTKPAGIHTNSTSEASTTKVRSSC